MKLSTHELYAGTFVKFDSVKKTNIQQYLLVPGQSHTRSGGETAWNKIVQVKKDISKAPLQSRWLSRRICAYSELKRD
jgi:hypothetical protein